MGDKGATACNFEGVFNGFRQVGKQRDHFLLGFEIVLGGQAAAGFLLVNDGPGMARTLSRVIETCGASEQAGTRETPAPVGLRGSLRERGLAS